jgi:hypothetical protein
MYPILVSNPSRHKASSGRSGSSLEIHRAAKLLRACGKGGLTTCTTRDLYYKEGRSNDLHYKERRSNDLHYKARRSNDLHYKKRRSNDLHYKKRRSNDLHYEAGVDPR